MIQALDVLSGAGLGNFPSNTNFRKYLFYAKLRASMDGK